MSQQRTRTAADTATETDEEGLGKDTSFHLLESRRRRWAIRRLNREGSAEIGDLAEQIAAWENGTSVEEVTSRQRRSAYTSLQQTHLPTLDEAGVVDFNADRGIVEATERMEDLDIYLEVVPERDIPWSTYYLGVGVLSCVLVGLAAVGGDLLALVPDLGWAALIAVTLTISAAIHAYRSRSMRVDSGDVPLKVEGEP
jgi:hypothetical protein